MSVLNQWDVVRVLIRPEDRDQHPTVVLSCVEFCQDARRQAINVLYGTNKSPATSLDGYEVTLNGADGLELGRVSPERRRQIGRKIVATFRLPL